MRLVAVIRRFFVSPDVVSLRGLALLIYPISARPGAAPFAFARDILHVRHTLGGRRRRSPTSNSRACVVGRALLPAPLIQVHDLRPYIGEQPCLKVILDEANDRLHRLVDVA